MNQKMLSSLSSLSFFFLSIVFSFGTLFAASVPQKLADKPIDKSIRIKAQDGKNYCYAPSFKNGEGYIYIDNCSSDYVLPARYDVFQRISYQMNNNWMCLSAPSSVTGIDGDSDQKWDYIILRPCVINDQNQRWIIKDNALYTADGRFRVKDYKWYAYISKTSSDYYDHTLDSSMQTWINTVATPGNISLKTPLAWKIIDRTKLGMYYIQNNQSSAGEIINLYYNPENGHIAQYYPGSADLFCMSSNITASQDWNWVSWNKCTDNIPKTNDKTYWDISFLVQNEGMFKDYQGNILRVTKYGTNWGVPYTAKPNYLAKDTSNTPESLFLISHDIERWVQYVNGNLGETLHYCPAPGTKTTQASRVKRSLPPDFVLNEAWIRRLWEIARTTNNRGSLISMCGVCLLHSYQMVAELQEYSRRGPLQGGGYFFNTTPNTDPFVSFRQRFPLLAQRIESTASFLNIRLRPQETPFTRSRRINHAMTLAILPQYGWHPSDLATDQTAIQNNIQSLFNAPVGTMWIYFVARANEQGTGPIGHAQPVLRTNDGLVLIPTNAPGISLEYFRNLIAPMRNVNDVINSISLGGTRALYSFTTFQITQSYQNPLSITFSENNCTGGGEDRRGNGNMPRSSLVNQCLSGRCLLQ